jgi:hypothetical protein
VDGGGAGRGGDEVATVAAMETLHSIDATVRGGNEVAPPTSSSQDISSGNPVGGTTAAATNPAIICA